MEKKYEFTSYDLEYRRELEKKRGSKIPDEEFYRYIQELRKHLKEYVKSVKKWVREKPWEAEQISKLVKDWEEKEKNAKLYEKLAKIKKLTVVELQKLLVVVFEKEEYIKLEFSKPAIKKDVVIGFTVQDSQVNRGEYDSRNRLKKLLKLTFRETNWRLMNEGVYYRLGILSGRLRGYELEEDLLNLIKRSIK